MSYRLPLAYNSVSAAEMDAVMQVMISGRMTQGDCVAAFEEQFARLHGVAHAIMVNSGSSANLVGLEALIYLSRAHPEVVGCEIAPGDEVVIQGLNWPSTIKPLLNTRLRPVFCDIDLDSLNASVADVDAVRTDRTRLVIAVPVLGNPSHIEELERYCSENNLALFVDGCESLGASTEHGRPIGAQGWGSAFSFYFSHHITTVEGGAIVTDHDHYAEFCRALRSHGWSRDLHHRLPGVDPAGIDPRFCFVLPGYNVRSTDLNAAIGSVQLDKLAGWLAARRDIALARVDALESASDRVAVPGGADRLPGHSWMAFPMLFSTKERRDHARGCLEAAGVETRPIIVGNVLRQPAAGWFDLTPGQPPLEACDRVFETGLMIGLDPTAAAGDEAWLHEQLRLCVEAG